MTHENEPMNPSQLWAALQTADEQTRKKIEKILTDGTKNQQPPTDEEAKEIADLLTN